MTSADLYDEVALRFPMLWPQMPEWRWTNVHDGTGPKVGVISALLAQHVASPSVVIVVRSDPGIAAILPTEAAANYIAPHVLRHDVQVADPLFMRFLSISTSGVATGDA